MQRIQIQTLAVSASTFQAVGASHRLAAHFRQDQSVPALIGALFMALPGKIGDGIIRAVLEVSTHRQFATLILIALNGMVIFMNTGWISPLILGRWRDSQRAAQG